MNDDGFRAAQPILLACLLSTTRIVRWDLRLARWSKVLRCQFADYMAEVLRLRAAPCEITTLTRAGPRWFIASSRACPHEAGDRLARACPWAGLGPDAWADQRHLSRLVVADLLGRDVELDHPHVLALVAAAGGNA